MSKIVDEYPDHNNHYPLTAEDIDAGFAADEAWNLQLVNLTSIDRRPTIVGASRAGELAVDELLTQLFPSGDTESPSIPHKSK